MPPSKDVLQKLKDKLPWGAITQVANEFSVHKSHVVRVASGEKENDAILEALLCKAEEHTKRKQDIEARITAL